MPSATASGSDAKANGSANQRGAAPQAGNQTRSFTPEQNAAITRINRCNPTDYYAILDLTALKPPATCSSSDVKKAYRKLSLLTHPDKTGHEKANTAFQMVSKAYLVLSDEGKKDSYDRSGRDPDSRFGGGGGGGGGAPASNPFAGFGARAGNGAGGRGGPEPEISAEEMFNMFFGGGGGGGPFGGGGLFGDGGSPFVFQMGANQPGIRVHQFGGPRPRRRPRGDNAAAEAPPAGLLQTIIHLLPILLIFIFPLITSLFSGESGPEKPSMYFPSPISRDAGNLTPHSPLSAFKHGKKPHTHGRVTNRWHVEYYLDPLEVVDWSPRMFSDQDRKAEQRYLSLLRLDCNTVVEERNRLIQEAQSFFGLLRDEDKINRARALDLGSCNRLNSLGLSR